MFSSQVNLFVRSRLWTLTCSLSESSTEGYYLRWGCWVSPNLKLDGQLHETHRQSMRCIMSMVLTSKLFSQFCRSYSWSKLSLVTMNHPTIFELHFYICSFVVSMDHPTLPIDGPKNDKRFGKFLISFLFHLV
jgi:hypothetical protein